jgi:hypothetical protein
VEGFDGTLLGSLSLSVSNSLLGLFNLSDSAMDSSASVVDGFMSVMLLGLGVLSLFDAGLLFVGLLGGSLRAIIEQLMRSEHRDSTKSSFGYLHIDLSHTEVVFSGVSKDDTSEESSSSNSVNEHYLFRLLQFISPF